MKSVAIASRKGGSGKSLLGIHLAVAFENCGVSTSIIDLDPQRSAWGWSQDRGKETYPDAYTPRLDQLTGFMSELAENDVQLCVIDTPPNSDERSLAAIRLADLILIPFRPSLLDLRALDDTVRLISMADKSDMSLLLLNAALSRSSLTAEALEAAAEIGLAICPAVIGERAAFNHAITNGKGITEYEPNGKAAGEITALRRFVAKRLKLKKGTA